MAVSVNSGNMPPQVQQTFNQKILATPQQRNIHSVLATPYTMGENEGDIMRFSRYNPLATAPVPLGVTMNNPPSQQLQRVDIDAQISWYGRHNCRSKTFSDFRETLSEAA